MAIPFRLLQTITTPSGPWSRLFPVFLLWILITNLQIFHPCMIPTAFGQEKPIVEDPFTESQLTASPPRVREGETITYTLTVRASGLEFPQKISVSFRLPEPTMLVSALPSIEFNEQDRNLAWEGEISPDQEHVFTITLITIPGSGNRGRVVANAAIYWRPKSKEWEAESHWLQSETEIRSKFTPILHALPNGMGISKVEFIILGYLVVVPLLTFLIPGIILWREKRRKPALPELEKTEAGSDKIFLFVASFAFVCALGVLPLMFFSAQKDIRRFVVYKKVSCTLLDKRIFLEEKSSWGKGGGPSRLSTSAEFNHPLVAVRYLAEGCDIITAGPPRPTAMLSPFDRYALRELAQYERGKIYPCWYDPQEPEIFVLAQGVSLGWYLLGAGPMLLLYFLGKTIMRKLTGRRTVV